MQVLKNTKNGITHEKKFKKKSKKIRTLICGIFASDLVPLILVLANQTVMSGSKSELKLLWREIGHGSEQKIIFGGDGEHKVDLGSLKEVVSRFSPEPFLPLLLLVSCPPPSLEHLMPPLSPSLSPPSFSLHPPALHLPSFLPLLALPSSLFPSLPYLPKGRYSDKSAMELPPSENKVQRGLWYHRCPPDSPICGLQC